MITSRTIANRIDSRFSIARYGAAGFALFGLIVGSAAASPQDEVRETFDHFVAAQNAHDINAVKSLLLASPDFFWITRGTPVWGTDAALQRFTALYNGTWHLDPELPALKVKMINDDTAEIYVPIIFTIGEKGQPAKPSKTMMNQILVRTPDGWKISTILPIPAPVP